MKVKQDNKRKELKEKKGKEIKMRRKRNVMSKMFQTGLVGS